MQTLQEILSLVLIKVKDYSITVADILLIVGLFIGVRIINRLLKKTLLRVIPARNKADENRKYAIIQIVHYLVYVFFVLASLEIVNVDISLLLAGSAALLVGLGFGLQNIANDIISGIIILMEGNVNTGDVIEVNGIIGKVESIGLRTSKVRTREMITIIVPNSKFISDNVINWSHGNFITRFKVSVGVAYGSDVQKVKAILLECARKHPKSAKKPEPFVRFVNFGESSLDFELFFWSEEILMIEDVKSDLRFSIDQGFREGNISIPFPQRDLHIVSSAVPLA